MVLGLACGFFDQPTGGMHPLRIDLENGGGKSI
jgi:hypothetical protein